MSEVPVEVYEVIDANKNCGIGSTFKVKHEYKDTGEACSKFKSQALAITRTDWGWTWFCHRCGNKGGFKRMDNLSAEDIKERIRTLTKKEIDPVIHMPHDTIQIHPVDLAGNSGNIPWSAQTWLFENGISGYHLNLFFFGWSPLHRRVIIPVYSSPMTHINFDIPKLVGWVGRDPEKLTREERIKYKRPKYLTKKCKMNNRLLFAAGPKVMDEINNQLCVILVEDAISAIRVFDASRCWGIGLLCDSVPRFLLDNIGLNKLIILWLDPNMHRKMIQDCIAFRSLGYNIRYVLSKKDPKHYQDYEIRTIIAAASASANGVNTEKLEYIKE